MNKCPCKPGRQDGPISRPSWGPRQACKDTPHQAGPLVGVPALVHLVGASTPQNPDGGQGDPCTTGSGITFALERVSAIRKRSGCCGMQMSVHADAIAGVTPSGACSSTRTRLATRCGEGHIAMAWPGTLWQRGLSARRVPIRAPISPAHRPPAAVRLGALWQVSDPCAHKISFHASQCAICMRGSRLLPDARAHVIAGRAAHRHVACRPAPAEVAAARAVHAVAVAIAVIQVAAARECSGVLAQEVLSLAAVHACTPTQCCACAGGTGIACRHLHVMSRALVQARAGQHMPSEADCVLHYGEPWIAAAHQHRMTGQAYIWRGRCVRLQRLRHHDYLDTCLCPGANALPSAASAAAHARLLSSSLHANPTGGCNAHAVIAQPVLGAEATRSERTL